MMAVLSDLVQFSFTAQISGIIIIKSFLMIIIEQVMIQSMNNTTITDI